MKRRTFLHLAGVFASLGLPWTASASQESSCSEQMSVSCVPKRHLAEIENLRKTIIKVVGIGSAGRNAVEHMIHERVRGVEFICIDTDSESLSRSSAGTKVLLGAGLGSGGKPKLARDMADEGRTRIAALLQGAEMVFITAGMGGGTGTGVSPIVAEVAHELGILTVAVVTTPFTFEGRRVRVAEQGIYDLVLSADSLIAFPNEKLMDMMGEEVSMLEAFRYSDNMLMNAIRGIAEIINVPGLIAVALMDLRAVLGHGGTGMIGWATAGGIDRAHIAAGKALCHPLLEDKTLSDARGVLVNITASSQLRMKEVKEALATVRNYMSPKVTIVFGTVYDDGMADQLRVTLIATKSNGSGFI